LENLLLLFLYLLYICIVVFSNKHFSFIHSFIQLIYNALLECSPSLKRTLLQLWQNEVTLNIHGNVYY